MRFNAPRSLRPGIPELAGLAIAETVSSVGKAVVWTGLVIASAVVAGPGVAFEEIRRAREARANRREPWEAPGKRT